MADSNASFIPKNTQRVQKKVRTTYRIYLLSYLSYVFFFGTLIAVIGTYFYAIQVQSGLESVKTDLDNARQAFSESDIEGVRELEKRLLAANQLLSRLAAPSRVFTEIEKIVADNIKFIQFSYEALPGQKASLALTGKADDFNQIIYQRDLMNSSLLFESNPVLNFDYSAAAFGSDGETQSIAPETTEVATLTFTISNEISTTLIPYQAQVTTDTNLVTEVRSTDGAEETAVTDSDVVSEEVGVTGGSEAEADQSNETNF